MDLISIADTTTFLLGSGRGDFSTFSSLATTGVNSGRIADINFDGNLDLVVANYSGTTGSTFTTYLGNGNGSFSSGVAYTTVGSPFPIELADINNDGYQDVVTGGNVGSLMGVHLNNKDGTFSSTGSYAAGGSQYGFAVGDLTGDGVVEIIAGSAFSSSIRVLSQTSTKSSNQSYFSLYRQEDARIALPLLDLTLQRINREVGKIGAYQKRFETAFGTISAMRENYQAAEARITDIDIAAASAEYVRTNILQQIAASIASQANQTPRLVLELLKN
jgi:flagellin-like hook-associated protein FlgL